MSVTSHHKPKMALTKTFTKGGQVTLHNIRMIRQVLTVTLILTLIGGVLFWGTKTWFDYTPYQRYLIGSAYWAEVKLAVSGNNEKETQIYRYENGKEHLVRSIDIKRNKAIQFWIKSFESQMLKNCWLSLWFMGGFFLTICAFWTWRGNVRRAKEIVSGSEIVEPEVLQRLLKNQNIASPFIIGDVNLRLNSETQHMMVCGTTGTGKSTCFYHLFPQIRAQGQRAVIVDTTGEFVSRFYRPGKDILINPFDERSVRWDPWIDCRFPYHYDELASAFIPQTGQDSFWASSARTVFSESLQHLSRQNTKSIDALLHLLLETSLKELFVALRNTSAASLIDPAGDRTAMSIRSHLTPYLKNLRYLSSDKSVNRSTPAFSVRDWVQKETSVEKVARSRVEKPSGEVLGRSLEESDPQWLFIASSPDQRETLKPLLTGLMSSAINSLLSSEPHQTRRLWFVIDELACLNKQEALPKALAEIRKYGGCVAVGIQNIPQLQGQYGHAETKSLTSLFNTKIIFRNGDPETAKHMSQMLGEQEVKESMEGISYGAHQMRDGVSLNEQKRLKPVVSANDIMILEDLEAYLKLPGNLPVAKIKFNLDQREKKCSGFMPIVEEKKAAKTRKKTQKKAKDKMSTRKAKLAAAEAGGTKEKKQKQ